MRRVSNAEWMPVLGGSRTWPVGAVLAPQVVLGRRDKRAHEPERLDLVLVVLARHSLVGAVGLERAVRCEAAFRGCGSADVDPHCARQAAHCRHLHAKQVLCEESAEGARASRLQQARETASTACRGRTILLNTLRPSSHRPYALVLRKTRSKPTTTLIMGVTLLVRLRLRPYTRSRTATAAAQRVKKATDCHERPMVEPRMRSASRHQPTREGRMRCG